MNKYIFVYLVIGTISMQASDKERLLQETDSEKNEFAEPLIRRGAIRKKLQPSTLVVAVDALVLSQTKTSRDDQNSSTEVESDDTERLLRRQQYEKLRNEIVALSIQKTEQKQ